MNKNIVKFREWLNEQKITEDFVLESMHHLWMADAKTLEDLSAKALERLWELRERIVERWKLTTGTVVSIQPNVRR